VRQGGSGVQGSRERARRGARLRAARHLRLGALFEQVRAAARVQARQRGLGQAGHGLARRQLLDPPHDLVHRQALPAAAAARVAAAAPCAARMPARVHARSCSCPLPGPGMRSPAAQISLHLDGVCRGHCAGAWDPAPHILAVWRTMAITGHSRFALTKAANCDGAGQARPGGKGPLGGDAAGPRAWGSRRGCRGQSPRPPRGTARCPRCTARPSRQPAAPPAPARRASRAAARAPARARRWARSPRPAARAPRRPSRCGSTAGAPAGRQRCGLCSGGCCTRASAEL